MDEEKTEMSTYTHYQEAKKNEHIPDPEHVGACLTCGFWDDETHRNTIQTQQIAVCVHPTLKPFALLVSGSSACNKWMKKPDVDPQAESYSMAGA